MMPRGDLLTRYLLVILALLAWTAGATESAEQRSRRWMRVRVPSVTPVGGSGGVDRGPSAARTCTASVNGTTIIAVPPGASTIHDAVSANDAGDVLCIAAGTYTITTGVTPKSNMTFFCEDGAIISAAGIGGTGTGEEGAIRAHNENIDSVTIKNCEITGSLGKAVYLFSDSDAATGWIVEYNHFHNNVDGVQLQDGFVLQHNIIEKNIGPCGRAGGVMSGAALTPYNSTVTKACSDEFTYDRGGAYVFYQGSLAGTIDDNEISYNGFEQKSTNEDSAIAWTNNWVHHNMGAGIWCDSNGPGTTVIGNTIEDNGEEGVFIEKCYNVDVSYNTISRNGLVIPGNGIHIGTTRDINVHHNTFDDNDTGVRLFVTCPDVPDTGSYPWGADLMNVQVYENVFYLRQSGQYGGSLSYSGSGTNCPSPNYTGSPNTKNNDFLNNDYHVLDDAASNNFYWDGDHTWTQWKALPQDAAGTGSTLDEAL